VQYFGTIVEPGYAGNGFRHSEVLDSRNAVARLMAALSEIYIAFTDYQDQSPMSQR